MIELKMYKIMTIMILLTFNLTSCSEDIQEKTHSKNDSKQKEEQKKDYKLPMPESYIIITSKPTGVVTGNYAASITNTPVVQEEIQEEQTQDEAGEKAGSDPSCIFDLNTVNLSPLELENQGIKLLELNDVRILEFTTNSKTLVLPVDNLPTGAQARTVLTVVKKKEMSKCNIIEYGTNRKREAFGFFVGQIPYKYVFSAYAHNIITPHVKFDEWNVLVVTYKDDKAQLYLNGLMINTQVGMINTYPSDTIQIGSAFNGGISGIKIWNRELAKSEIKKNTNEMFFLLK